MVVDEFAPRVFRAFTTGRFRLVLMDFDGTISLLRSGWDDVMREVMLESITGGVNAEPGVQAEVDQYIEQSAGLSALHQMQHLAAMVRRHGRVASVKMLDGHGYKAIFNTRLLARVGARIRKMESGEAVAEDMTVHGVIPFIRLLHARGMRLSILSGTDEDAVRHEAGLLGIVDYFENVWGGAPHKPHYTKAGILDEVLAECGGRREEVLVIGDGAIEIREAHARGCAAIGVAANDHTGRGWDESKCELLRAAGADWLIPDYRSTEQLVEQLFKT